MAEEDRWIKLEQIVEKILRKVLREELSILKKPEKTKLGFKNGMFTGLGTVEMAALEAAYPAVNISQEINQAAAWILTHPNDAPRSNYGAFLNTWLKRHQDRHAIRTISSPAMQIKQKLCAYCPREASGTINGYDHCREHAQSAMDGERPMGQIKRA